MRPTPFTPFRPAILFANCVMISMICPIYGGREIRGATREQKNEQIDQTRYTIFRDPHATSLCTPYIYDDDKKLLIINVLRRLISRGKTRGRGGEKG